MNSIKVIAILLTALLLLCGCSGRGNNSSAPEESVESISDAPSSSADTSSSGVEAAADNNARLNEAEINLIQFQPVRPGDTIAVMETSMGTIRIRLFPDHAPKTVANFIGLAEEGYYNGKNFHRVVDNFMIQGGAMNSDGTGATSVYKDENGNAQPFEDEFTTDLWNFRGALSMANPGIEDSNMSQFFIVQRRTVDERAIEHMRRIQYPNKVVEKYIETGGAQHLDWYHTVFGQVIEGMEVVDAIAAVETSDGERPLHDVIITSLTIEEAE